MFLLAAALLAGVLTTLAPCVLPLLPVIVGGSVGGTSRTRPYWIALGLGVSVIAFTLLLKATTAALQVPPQVWPWISGGLLIVLGLFTAFPSAWNAIATRLRLSDQAHHRLSQAHGTEGRWGAILTGAALGPVFSSCSPLYGYVVVTVLPATPTWGMALLLSYTVGLTGTLLAVSLAGRSLISRLGWAAGDGWFRRVLGLVFVAVGIAVLTGLDKFVQTWLLQYVNLPVWTWDASLLP